MDDSMFDSVYPAVQEIKSLDKLNKVVRVLSIAYCAYKHQPEQYGIDFSINFEKALRDYPVDPSNSMSGMRQWIQILWSSFIRIGPVSAPPTFRKELCSIINEALRLDAGCHQMMMPAMQLIRTLNENCCLIDRTHPQTLAGAFVAGISFPEIKKVPGTAEVVCCTFRGSWIDKNMLHEFYGKAQENKALRIISCLATSLKLDTAKGFICRSWAAAATPLDLGPLVAVLFRIHGYL